MDSIDLKTDTINISGRISDLLNHIPSEMKKESLLNGMIYGRIMI